MNRTRGTDNYIERQLFASNSHINLINKLKTIFNIDVFLNTYKLNETDDENLKNIYLNNGVKLIQSEFYDVVFPSEDLFLNNMYDKTCLLLNQKEYDFVLYFRIDLYLKKYFIDNIIFENDIIKFAHIDSNFCGIDYETRNVTKMKGICQQIMLFPKKYFHVIINKIIYNATHGIYDNLIHNNIDINDIRFFVNSLHICSTDIDWNPLYVQVGRKYCSSNEDVNNIFIDNSFIYDNSENIIKPDQNIQIYWKNYINNEEKIENDEINKVCNEVEIK